MSQRVLDPVNVDGGEVRCLSTRAGRRGDGEQWRTFFAGCRTTQQHIASRSIWHIACPRHLGDVQAASATDRDDRRGWTVSERLYTPGNGPIGRIRREVAEESSGACEAPNAGNSRLDRVQRDDRRIDDDERFAVCWKVPRHLVDAGQHCGNVLVCRRCGERVALIQAQFLARIHRGAR